MDTNILVHSIDSEDLLYQEAVDAIDILQEYQVPCYVVPQNLTEFLSVYSRPVEKNGMGHTAAEALREIKRIKQLFRLLKGRPEIEIYEEWERLINTYGVEGRQVYDTRLVANMLVYDLTHILTFDYEDFDYYEGITAVHPVHLKQKRLFKKHFF